jgi:hypothetical protein
MAKKGKQGDGGGNPDKALIVFDYDMTKELQDLASVLNKGQLASYFGITERTLSNIEKRQPEVRQAYEFGRASKIAAMGNNLVQLALDGNVTANIFYLKTQGGWKEEQAESNAQPISINIVQPSE